MVLSLSLILFLSTLSYADESCSKDLAALLECVDQKAPELQRARLNLERLKLQESVAGQWRNPEFGVNSVSGKVAGEKNAETDLTLGVPIELGGKISARKEFSRAQTEGANAALYAARAEVRAKALLNLHRFRQASHELEVVEESIRSFGKLLNQFSSRARLSPEQETSASVYRMAKSEYELKRAELNDELAEIGTFFRVNAAIELSAAKRLLPLSPTAWPSIPAAPTVDNSPRIRALGADVRAAEAELRAARSEAWPALTVGPSAKLQTTGSDSGTLLGFNIGLTVPFFNANGAGKAAARASLQGAEAVRDLGLNAELSTRAQAERIYRQSTELLGSTLSHREIERAHGEVERLFTRGIVPSSLVIEAHRSYLELERARSERERKAIAAFLEIYTIEGSILEKTI